MIEQFTDNDMADGISALERREVGAVFADALIGETLGSAHAARLTIKIAYGAQYEDASSVNATGIREELQGLQGPGVLHRRGCELTLTSGEVGHPTRRPCVEKFAMPVGGRGNLVTHSDEWRILRSVEHTSEP